MINPNNLPNDTRNFLAREQYMIPRDLQSSLESGVLHSTETLRTDKFYLVMIRVFNKNSKILVYSHISYPYLFHNTVLYFLATRGVKISNIYKESGDLLVVLDKDLDRQPTEDNDVLRYSKPLYDLDEVLRTRFEYDYPFTNAQIFKFINRLVLLSDTNSMSFLVDLAFKRDYHAFVKEVLGSLDSYARVAKDLSCDRNIEPISILNGCIFVVKDIENFILSVKNMGYNFNAGPKSLRGQVNSINNCLSILDLEYRKSLYCHNNYHVASGNIDSVLKLSKEKFSFNNIHMNLGGVRWYSSRSRSPANSNFNKTPNILHKISNNNELSIFNQLSEYLKNLPINEDTQLEIEDFLLGYSRILFDRKQTKRNKSAIDYDLLGNKFAKLLSSKQIVLIDYINNVRERVYLNKPKKIKEINLYYLHNILKDVDNLYVISIINGRLLRIININNKLDNTESNICLELARDLTKSYHYRLYTKDKATKIGGLSYSMFDWKKNNKDILDVYNEKDDRLMGYIGAVLVKWMLDLDLIEQDWIKISRTETQNILLPSKEVLDTLNNANNMFHFPHKLPMIVKPKPYYRNNGVGEIKEGLGGYLLNDVKYTDEIIKPKWDQKEPSTVREDNVIYDLVNNISSVGFKINKDVLGFIDSYGIEYNLLDVEGSEDLISKSKFTKSEYAELESLLSKKRLQENVLGLARAYSNVHEFYLPVRLDFRGRVNCMSEYLNYQSNELAKSLLLFSKPENVSKADERSISFLKAYGASCFGNKLDKKSWNERAEWVDDNIEGIINFRNGELISQSENKLLFVAFCFEYNRFLQSLENNDTVHFETHLPIRLDATCNGYQHLALLSLDKNLAKELNLTKSTWNDTPKDFYGFIGVNLLSLFREKLSNDNLNNEDRDSYVRLASINILRGILKKAVMTWAYGITPLNMIKKIQESFGICNIGEISPSYHQWQLKDIKKIKFTQGEVNLIKSSNIIEYIRNNYELCSMDDMAYLDRWYKLKTDHNIKLLQRDFIIIRSGIEEILNNDMFKIRKLMNYMESIAKILTKLNLVIPWSSPNGVDVNQSYLATKEVRLKPFSYSKRTFSLVVSEGKLFNKTKQIRAFMPNLVHSLDAASLALLVDLYFNTKNGDNSYKNLKNIFTVHDCFAVTANNVKDVMDLLELVYTRIYSESNYLRKLDKGIIDYIKLIYKDKCFDHKKLEININGNVYKYPNINGVLGTDSSAADFMIGSSYLIN